MSYRSLDFITFVFLLLSGVSLAQPTIESIHMPVSGDTIRYTQATLSNNYDFSTTGANSTKRNYKSDSNMSAGLTQHYLDLTCMD